MDHSQTILALTQDLLSRTGFGEETEVQVLYHTDDNTYEVAIATPDPGLLIGYHGDTLSALQFILAQHLNAQLSEWLTLSVNVNDYRERREAALKAMTDSVIAKVLETGQAQTLPPLPANERRIIHIYLSEHPEVSTESVGEGRARSVVISLRK